MPGSKDASTPPKVPPPPKAPPQPPAVKQAGSSNTSGAGTQAQGNLPKLPSLPGKSTAASAPPSFVIAAAQAVALSFGSSTHYAIVGGAACLLLGGSRTTSDVDVVVLRGETKTARDKLAAQVTQFSVAPKTRHTNYNSTPSVEIEILTPPLLFKEKFEEQTPTVIAHGVKILKPTLILNAKCGSILGRSTEAKKQTDSMDIMFLLEWCTSHSMQPTSYECPKVDAAFVQWFNDTFEDEDSFERAGWDKANGTSLLKYLYLPFDQYLLTSASYVILGCWAHEQTAQGA